MLIIFSILSSCIQRLKIVVWILLPLALKAQQINPEILERPWKGHWVTIPAGSKDSPSLEDYGVYKLRKSFHLAEKPLLFIAHVSADNKYKLFVNGHQVLMGPARSDLYFWNFETVDLAPYLQEGNNTVAALVWNEGVQKPLAQISHRSAFIMQGNSASEQLINSDTSWKIIKDTSYRPLPVRVPGYYVAGPGEFVDMNASISGWQETKYDDRTWKKVRSLGPGLPKRAAINSTGWMLVPSPLPQMELSSQRLSSVRNAVGIDVPASFPRLKASITIPANSIATLLLDQGFLTNAYPTIAFSAGKDASIALGYAEALFHYNNEDLTGEWISELPKGNRDVVEGKKFIGRTDSLISNGSRLQQYTPLSWRTYRYIHLKIYTKGEPLILEDLYGTFTGYPFKQVAKFETTNVDFKTILEIGWRTARLCAMETYMDCPYYEQLQYFGDARIQAMVSLYNTVDDRLVKNALNLADYSRMAEGITLSRYPSNLPQQIPTFSLSWIGMLHDYWMYGQDSSFVKAKLPGERQVLSFFERYQQPDGSLSNVPYWIFTDWVEGRKGWNFGMAPLGTNGESAVLDLQLLWTYQLAAAMEKEMGLMDLYRLYTAKAARLKQTVQKKYWDGTRRLYADTEKKDVFSQHTNSLAILTGIINGEKAADLGRRMLTDFTLAPASIYFKYYLHQGLIKAGLGNDYMNWLGKWRENIDLGLTTWAEVSDVNLSRSDCHAWGSSPNIEFYRTVLGIDSDAPGFTKVKIEPHLGTLKNISGEVPHPLGKISVRYIESNGLLRAEINLPAQTPGRFIWRNKTFKLKEGMNTIVIN